MRNRGFTLIELVVILVLLGILSISIYARLSPQSIEARGFAFEVMAAMRFAHKLALTSGCDVQVSITASPAAYGLYLRSDATGAASNCLGASGAFTQAVNNPATGSAFTGAGPTGSVSGNWQFFFNASGAPSSVGSVSVAGTALTVEAGTGLVY